MDFDLLLRPLEGRAGPCGEDMTFSPEFDAIREARRFDDPSLAQGEWVTDLKEADWPGVLRIGGQLLAERTKDVRVATWITEALTKTRGLAGLAEGFELVERLCGAFWATLHPQPDDGDMELRIGSLDWLASQSERLVREVPLTRSAKGDFTLIDLESARATAASMERNPGQADAVAGSARITMDVFEAARRDTAGDFFSSGLAAAERVDTALAALRATLDGLLAKEAPAFGAVSDALEDVRLLLRRYAAEAGVAQRPAMQTPVAAVRAAAAAPSVEGPSEETVPGGGLRSREQAIRQLSEVAEFFKRTEPHSPVAYLAEKAARWGRMPLHEWLRSVLKDDAALSHVEEQLGVEAPRSEQP